MRVDTKKFFLALLLFFGTLTGVGVHQYKSAKEEALSGIKKNLEQAVQSASIIAGDSYHDYIYHNKLTQVEEATIIQNMAALAETMEMAELYTVLIDGNKTLRYGANNLIGAAIINQALLRAKMKSSRPSFEFDENGGGHTLYTPHTTPLGVHYLVVATTKTISLKKLSQTAIFDTIAKSLLLLLGALPFIILYRNMLARAADELSDEIDETYEKLHETTAILEEKVEEKTKELIAESFEDPLTHLPNRHALMFDLDRYDYSALIIVHLQNFQELNHFFGIPIGESLLQQFGLWMTRMKYTSYRLGRDEFALLIKNQNSREAITEFCEDFLYQLSEHSFHAAHESVALRAVLGIDATHALSLAHANTALQYAAENTQPFSYYEGEVDTTHEHQINIDTAASIREAFHDGRIICYYQPIESTATGDVEAYETLARLIGKDASIIPPLNFLNVARKTRLYPAITQEIIRQSCDAFKDRAENFSVNLSSLDILDFDTVRYIEETIVSLEIAERIIFELSEKDIYEHFLPMSNFIQHMKRLGAKIAIDNFGSSYSNFEKILHLNIDYLKIDGSLINNITHGPRYVGVVRSIISLANAIGARSIAENVESEETLVHVRDLGINFVQGYHIGKPGPCCIDV